MAHSSRGLLARHEIQKALNTQQLYLCRGTLLFGWSAMGIFTWLVRASEEEMYANVTSKGRTTEDVMKFAGSDAIKTMDVGLRTPSTDDYYSNSRNNRTGTNNTPQEETEAETEAEQPKSKRAKIDNDNSIEQERRHDMDKSWEKLHDQICIHYGVGGSERTQRGGGFMGEAPQYEQYSVSYFMTNTTKNHNKYFMVTLSPHGSCDTNFGSIADLRPQERTTTSSSSRSRNSDDGGLDQCTHTIVSKLKKGYRCRAIGITSLVKNCFGWGKFSLPKNDTDANTNATETDDPSGLRRPCVPDFIDYQQAKDAGVKKILAQAGTLRRGGNAADRTLALFDTLCEEFCFVPRRRQTDAAGRQPLLSKPDCAPFLLEGGEATPCPVGLDGPGRVLSARLVQAWDRFLRGLDPEDVALKCGEMDGDDYKYHKIHIRSLRYFVHLAAKADQAILIYLG